MGEKTIEARGAHALTDTDRPQGVEIPHPSGRFARLRLATDTASPGSACSDTNKKHKRGADPLAGEGLAEALAPSKL